MPYIEQKERLRWEQVLNEFDEAISTHVPSAGEMNYLITSFLHRWLQLVGIRYINLNAVIGIIECAKLELYRQVAAKYEDGKKDGNGSVSDLDEHD